MNPHHLIDEQWLQEFHSKEWPTRRDDFVHGALKYFRYHGATGKLVMSKWDYETNFLRLFLVDLPSHKVQLLHEEPCGEPSRHWRHLEMTTDGRYVVAATGHYTGRHGSGGTKMMVWDDDALIFEASDPTIPLRFEDHNESYQFFSVLHPNNKLCYFWMYASQKLFALDMQTGQVAKIKMNAAFVDGMAISECGNRLLCSELGKIRVGTLPQWKEQWVLTHTFGYFYWGATAVGLNASGSLAVGFYGNERTAYRDINFGVSDYDSHLVMWQKDALGNWCAQDVVHFAPLAIDDECSVSIRAVDDKLYWAGVVNDFNILIVEFPSLRQLTIAADLDLGSKIWLSHDAKRVYCGDTVEQLRWYELPIWAEAEDGPGPRLGD